MLNDLTVAAADEPFLRRHGLTSLDALFARRDGQHLSKPGLAPWRERLRLELAGGTGSRVLYLKRFTNPPASARRDARCCGAPSVAGVEWRWLHALAAIGVPTARPVAFGEEFRGSRERRSAVLMAAAPGESLERRVTSAIGGEERERLLAATARLVGRLHGAGIVHRDLYLSHLLWHADEQFVDGTLTLIDLQRVCRPAWRLRRWVIKDLAALSYSTPAGVVSRSARLRWLIRYQAECAGDGPVGAAPGEPDARSEGASEPTGVDPASGHGTLPGSPGGGNPGPVRRRGRVDRALVYRIAGKVSAMARHDIRRRERHAREGSGA